MDTVLWIVQSLLAGIFLATGLIKAHPTAPQDGGGTDGMGRRRHRRPSAPSGRWRSSARSGRSSPARWESRPASCRCRARARLVLTMIGAIVNHVRYGEGLGAWQCRSSCSDWRCSSPWSASPLTASEPADGSDLPRRHRAERRPGASSPSPRARVTASLRVCASSLA